MRYGGVEPEFVSRFRGELVFDHGRRTTTNGDGETTPNSHSRFDRSSQSQKKINKKLRRRERPLPETTILPTKTAGEEGSEPMKWTGERPMLRPKGQDNTPRDHTTRKLNRGIILITIVSAIILLNHYNIKNKMTIRCSYLFYYRNLLQLWRGYIKKFCRNPRRRIPRRFNFVIQGGTMQAHFHKKSTN